MTERPIPFSAPMVRAILGNRKTMTRRAVKPQPDVVTMDGRGGKCESRAFVDNKKLRRIPQSPLDKGDLVLKEINCPYGKPGDRLWVRESFWECGRWEQDYGAPGSCDVAGKYWKRFGAWSFDEDLLIQIPGNVWRRIPSMFMPHRLARIFLPIVSVRVELLNGISDADLKAEGIDQVRKEWSQRGNFCEILTDRELFAVLWDSLNGEGSWAKNPWVWVVEFRRLEKGEQP